MKELTLQSESYITPELMFINIEPSSHILKGSPVEDPEEGGTIIVN